MANRGLTVSVLFLAMAVAEVAAAEGVPSAKVSYDDYVRLVAEVEPHRARRLVDLDTFLAMAAQPGVVILDSRPRYRFERLHIDGARHLEFSDFTSESLATVIPSPDTPVLIYCNNNFAGDPPDFPTKVALPPALAAARAEDSADSPVATPLMLALNVPTYVHLYGYGYRNVYELSELVAMDDPRIVFAGSRAGQVQR